MSIHETAETDEEVKDARYNGAYAFVEGKKRTENPYPYILLPRRFESWDRGWCAEHDAREVHYTTEKRSEAERANYRTGGPKTAR